MGYEDRFLVRVSNRVMGGVEISTQNYVQHIMCTCSSFIFMAFFILAVTLMRACPLPIVVIKRRVKLGGRKQGKNDEKTGKSIVLCTIPIVEYRKEGY